MDQGQKNAPYATPVSELTEDAKTRIGAVLDRAAKDIDFREELLSDPASALKTSDLNPDEIKMLSDLRRVKLEEWGLDVRRFRAFMRDNGNKVSPLHAAILDRQ